MGLPVTYLSPATRSDTSENLAKYLSGKSGNWLLIPWDEIKGSVNATTEKPMALEEWLAAIVYQVVDLSVKTPNGEKLFTAASNPPSLDNGFFKPGQQFIVYSVNLSMYSAASLGNRPSLNTL